MALTAWALLAHRRLGSDAFGGGSTNNTVTVSTSTSSETQTTTATVRVDTFATRLVATDGIGGLVSDATVPLPFADAAVQAAIDAAEAALLAGPPASLFVKGPTLVETTQTLLNSTTMTVETGRTSTQIVTLEDTIGPRCIGTGDRDVPNTAPCPCFGETAARGVPYCVESGTSNINTNVDTHTVVDELRTTTHTYLTTEHYALRGSVLDHFLLYKVKTAKGTPKLAAFGPVTLTDALGAADYDIVKLPALGLPADKNTEGRADATTHLAQYALKRRKVSGGVGVNGPLGTATLDTAKEVELCIPSTAVLP